MTDRPALLSFQPTGINLNATVLGEGNEIRHIMDAGRLAWIQVVRGEVEINGQSVKAGDGYAVSNEADIDLLGKSATEVLLFDMTA